MIKFDMKKACICRHICSHAIDEFISILIFITLSLCHIRFGYIPEPVKWCTFLETVFDLVKDLIYIPVCNPSDIHYPDQKFLPELY